MMYMVKILGKLNSIFIPDEYNEFRPPALRERALFFYGAGLLILKIIILLLIFYIPRTDFFAAISTQALVDLINQERQQKNLAPLNYNSQLSQAAYLKAEDMIVNDYFDHYSPSGVTPWDWFKKAGYSFSWAGENLAMHFFETEKVFQAWMDSPSHRDNILSPNFKEIGVAVVSGELLDQETTVSVLTFGSSKTTKVVEPQTVAISPKPSPSSQEVLPLTQVKEEAEVEEKTQEPKTTPPPIQSQEPVGLVQVPNLGQAKILGAAALNLVELAKNIFIYFSLFLIIALAINILVKIRIQHLPTIVLTVILIGISISLIFI